MCTHADVTVYGEFWEDISSFGAAMLTLLRVDVGTLYNVDGTRLIQLVYQVRCMCCGGEGSGPLLSCLHVPGPA